MSARRWAFVWILLPWISGCTSSLAGKGTPVSLAEATSASELVLAKTLKVALTQGGTKDLHQGSRWRSVGDIPQGTVFKPVQEVLLIRTDDNYEAFLVVEQDTVAGVYIPYEKLFIAAKAAVPLH